MDTSTASELGAPALRGTGIAHGFAGRDRPVARGFHLVRARQVHGSALRWVDATTPSPSGELDALLTDCAGVAVAVATADCVPLLLAAPDDGVVAAVHAGWRGTLSGIVGAVIDELRRRRGIAPERLRAALGPSIDGCCFEIEREIAARFATRLGAGVWRFWRDGAPGKGTLDLRELDRAILLEAGLPGEAIERVGPCTHCGGGPFASYRREGASAGRQLSWIGLGAAT